MTQQPEVPSANSPPPSARRMTLVAEKRLPEPPPGQPLSLSEIIGSSNPTTTASAATPPKSPFTQPVITQEYISRTAWRQGVIGALNVLTAILAVRLILLVSVGGATFLAWEALREPDPYRLAVLGVYVALAVMPLVWLAARR
jgi:hypothetical protein